MKLISASSSIAVALIDPYQIAEFAYKLEIEELSLESGVQDQYAAAFGGINFMEIDYPTVKISSIKVDAKNFELESQMIRVYFGSRSSSEMHLQVIKNYKEIKLFEKRFKPIKRKNFLDLKIFFNVVRQLKRILIDFLLL